jgi:hypothetical protein
MKRIDKSVAVLPRFAAAMERRGRKSSARRRAPLASIPTAAMLISLSPSSLPPGTILQHSPI